MARTSIYLPGPGADSTQPNLVPDAAVRGSYLFTGGVAGYNADGTLSDSPETQAERVYDRIAAILKAANFTSGDIGHWFVWSPVRLSNIKAVNPKWAEWFPTVSDRPARHALSRELDPGMAYRIEIIGVKNTRRRSYEIKGPYHTGGSGIPHFMPFGTTMGNVLFTGPTYGMDVDMKALGQTAHEQAELCEKRNQDLYDLTGHSADNIAQMFVWYHDDASREAAINYTDVLFPNRNDRPAIHYIDANLPGGNFISGQLSSGRTATEAEDEGKNWQFLIQYDTIAVGNEKRRPITVPGVEPMDGANGAVPAGITIGNLCFTSVILGNRSRTGAPASSLEEQTTNAFDNARAVIAAGGFDVADIGHVYVWYTDHSARETVDRVWAKQFPDADQRPARHCLAGKLPEGALIGVELTAAR